jgi:hypothetical protein
VERARQSLRLATQKRSIPTPEFASPADLFQNAGVQAILGDERTGRVREPYNTKIRVDMKNKLFPGSILFETFGFVEFLNRYNNEDRLNAPW